MVRKNWEPPVLGPAFAIENSPALLCFFAKADVSHGIFQPGPPVPALPSNGSFDLGIPLNHEILNYTVEMQPIVELIID